jgi:hypothetical protein
MTTHFGDFMTDQQSQKPLVQSSSSDIELGHGLAGAPAAGRRQGEWERGQEKEWECRLRDLQYCICELLIKNQQLRWLLESATNRQWEEFADECDQNITRDSQ